MVLSRSKRSLTLLRGVLLQFDQVTRPDKVRVVRVTVERNEQLSVVGLTARCALGTSGEPVSLTQQVNFGVLGQFNPSVNLRLCHDLTIQDGRVDVNYQKCLRIA